MKFLISQSLKSDNEGSKYNWIDIEYMTYFKKLGITIIPVDNMNDSTENYFNTDIQGIILSGSGDIEKITYSNIKKDNLSFSFERDRIENKLIEYALSSKIPLIGICHGMQKINDYLGGNIQPYYHCKKETFSKQGINHNICGLDDLIGKENIYSINQYHDHCILIEDLARDLKCFAVDVRFNTVEGFYSNKNRVLGIQWHPERKINDNIAEKIIQNFI